MDVPTPISVAVLLGTFRTRPIRRAVKRDAAMVQSITARDCSPAANTFRIFVPKPINIMEYCKIFLLQKVMPASMPDGRFQKARIIPNKIANTGPPTSFPTAGI